MCSTKLLPQVSSVKFAREYDKGQKQKNPSRAQSTGSRERIAKSIQLLPIASPRLDDAAWYEQNSLYEEENLFQASNCSEGTRQRPENTWYLLQRVHAKLRPNRWPVDHYNKLTEAYR